MTKQTYIMGIEGEPQAHIIENAEAVPFPPRPALRFTGAVTVIDGADATIVEVNPQEGPEGQQGPPGRDGIGLPGPQGIPGPPPEHQWDGTVLRIQNPDGSWGTGQDLIGPEGDRGPEGLPPAHLWQGTVLFWRNPDGSLDAGVDLQGPAGAPGQDGQPGPQGPQGPAGEGIGVPAGGSTGQALIKISNADYIMGWGNISYEDLLGRPSINGVTLSDGLSLDDLGIQAKTDLSVFLLKSALDGGTTGNALVRLSDGTWGWANVSYNNVADRPSINSIELVGNKTLAQLGIQPETDLSVYLLADGSRPMDAGYSPENPEDIATKGYVDANNSNIIVQPAAKLYVGSSTTLTESVPSNAVAVTFALNANNAYVYRDLTYTIPVAGQVSNLSWYRALLYMTGLNNEQAYTFQASWYLGSPTTGTLIAQESIPYDANGTRELVQLDVVANSIGQNTPYPANQVFTLRIGIQRNGGGNHTVTLNSTTAQPSVLLRNGGIIASTNVIDDNGTNTATQAARNRSYEAKISSLQAQVTELSAVSQEWYLP